jgi:microcin C transport system permease protein
MRFLIKNLNPITQKRLRRFIQKKRAYWSLWLLIILYIISLGSELICNNKPLYVRYNGKSYLPIFKYYPENTFLNNKKYTRPDYRKINNTAVFKNNKKNFMIFPLIPYGPYENIDPKSLRSEERVTLTMTLIPRVGNINIDNDFSVVRSISCGYFFNTENTSLHKIKFNNYWQISPELKKAIKGRFNNKPSSAISITQRNKIKPKIEAKISLSKFQSRSQPPRTVRITFRQVVSETTTPQTTIFDRDMNIIKSYSNLWEKIPNNQRTHIIELSKKRFNQYIDSFNLSIQDNIYKIDIDKNDINWPYPPVRDHWLGIDSTGRDVLARIIYGLRISMTFGFFLVAASMVIGTLVGAIQGYYGGKLDITGQRLIEIWSALPFLYVIILMGSIYGKGFGLLLFCYGIFNWIGISYYMRAEFLRLRKKQFVDAARCMGLPNRKIILKHILPNALTPIITFFPFSLVGAIGSLAALDFLGFGLPAPTASWGELLHQAKQFRWAWWLILYPSLSLFIVMILGIFIGEGVRDAFDPRPYSKME